MNDTLLGVVLFTVGFVEREKQCLDQTPQMCSIHSFNQRSVLSVSTLSLNVSLCLIALLCLRSIFLSYFSVKRFNIHNVMDAYKISGVSFISMFWKKNYASVAAQR